MNSYKASRSFRIVMIEFVLMLGIFAIIGVIIVKMFLSADAMSKEAEDYSKAVIKTESIAERLKGSSSFQEVLDELGMEKISDPDQLLYRTYYGRDWEPSDETGVYEIVIRLEYVPGSSGHLEQAEITSTRVKGRKIGKETSVSLCRLSVSKFVPN